MGREYADAEGTLRNARIRPDGAKLAGIQCDERRSTKEMKEKGLPNTSDGLPLLKLDV